MKIAVLTNAFNEPNNIIGGCIKQFSPFHFHHLVLCPERPWHGEWWKRDETSTVARNYGAEVVVGDWRSEAEQFNYGLKKLRDYDWVLIVDADERYSRRDIKTLEETLGKSYAQSIRPMSMRVYWKSADLTIVPDPVHMPTIAVRPGIIKFTDKRHTDSNNEEFVPITLHHFSYVRTNADMLKKIQTFEHAEEFDSAKWYVEKWLEWNEDTEDLHPIVPSEFKKAVYDPAPGEIKRLWNF